MAENIGEEVETSIVDPLVSDAGGNTTQLPSKGEVPSGPSMEPSVAPSLSTDPPPAIGANLDDPDADMRRKGGAKFLINSITNSLLDKKDE